MTPANATYYAKQSCPIYSDLMGQNKSGKSVSKGEAITVLYTRATTSNAIAYIRTSGGQYGFVWMSNLSKTK